MSVPVTPRSLRGVAACERLLAGHLAEALQRFGAAGERVIDLPPLAAGVVPAHLRVAAALLWCREVARGGLPDFVEVLAEGALSGRVHAPLSGAAAARLARYWRLRERRFQRAEREALYKRVFGGSTPEDDVEAGVSGLVGTLSEVGRAAPGRPLAPLEARAAVQGHALATALSARCVGVTAFAARDIVAHVRLALSVLGRPDMLAPLGVRTVGDALRRYGPEVLGRPLDVAGSFARADAGRQVLSWLADHATQTAAATVRLAPADPVVRAAEAWRVARPRP